MESLWKLQVLFDKEVLWARSQPPQHIQKKNHAVAHAAAIAVSVVRACGSVVIWALALALHARVRTHPLFIRPWLNPAQFFVDRM